MSFPWKGVVLGGSLVGGFTLFLLAMHCREQRAREPFDGDALLASGMREVAEHGAALERIEVTYVTPDGLVHPEYGGHLRAFWVATEERAEDKAVMPGAPRKGGGPRCTEYWLDARLEHDIEDGDYFDDKLRSNGDRDCTRPTVPGPLFCTLKGVWARAIAAGAPNPALATITLETSQERVRRWTLTVVDNVEHGPRKTLFSGEYADDCPVRVER